MCNVDERERECELACFRSCGATALFVFGKLNACPSEMVVKANKRFLCFESAIVVCIVVINYAQFIRILKCRIDE